MVKLGVKVLLLFLLIPSIALSNVYKAYVEDVTDGDTLSVKVTIWPHQVLSTNIRLYGIDAPEIKGKCQREKIKAVKAKEYLKSIVFNKHVIITNISNDKYHNRYVATVRFEGLNINHHMIAMGHAREYDGKSLRLSWCE